MGAACSSEQVYPYIDGAFSFLGEELICDTIFKPTSQALDDSEYVFLYFGRPSCDRCQKFSPCLASYFQGGREFGQPKADVVYVNMDGDESGMTAELDQYPWSAVPYSAPERLEVIREYGAEAAVGPYLVVFSQKGDVIQKDVAFYQHNGMRNTTGDFLEVCTKTPRLAKDFHKALNALIPKGPTAKACREILHPWQWQAVKDEFKEAYPDFHDGDLETAMLKQMKPGGLIQAEGILSCKRIYIRSEQERADARAKLAYNAMKGAGTDEDTVYLLCCAVATQREWDLLSKSFFENHADFEKGDLWRALKSEFSNADMGRAEWILEQRQVFIRPLVPGAPPTVESPMAQPQPQPQPVEVEGEA
eukprot:TRINITY_DN439_c6_g1_i1.p1 TRINITY_DN439_c6_g1~~TRINITY_DN439_c6_g1_i1.p1  ORF type:complete len:362 (+),score=142.80 TRINITY_DN439_c6_g1_i1:87-1172(+)